MRKNICSPQFCTYDAMVKHTFTNFSHNVSRSLHGGLKANLNTTPLHSISSSYWPIYLNTRGCFNFVKNGDRWSDNWRNFYLNSFRPWTTIRMSSLYIFWLPRQYFTRGKKLEYLQSVLVNLRISVFRPWNTIQQLTISVGRQLATVRKIVFRLRDR